MSAGGGHPAEPCEEMAGGGQGEKAGGKSALKEGLTSCSGLDCLSTRHPQEGVTVHDDHPLPQQGSST